MEKIRTKFNVAEITRYGNCGGTKVVLRPVVGNSSENKPFWEATPSGYLELIIDNDKAAAAFEFGEYYVDLTRVE